jgi:hypothetical protein
MNKPILFANGCSMCYGSGLFEDPETKLCFNNNERFASSWPGVLGRELGFRKVVNLGFPGSSNDRIVRTTIAWILENGFTEPQVTNSIFVIIGWSGPMRREFYIHDDWRQLIPYHDYVDIPAALLNRIYREVAWSEYESAIRFATQIISLQAFFRSHKIPYLFFDAITSFMNTNIDSDNALDIYLPHIDQNNYFNFKDKIGDMATQVGDSLKGAERGHPNSAGHFEWAHKLAKFIREKQLYFALNESIVNSEPIIFEGTGTVEIFDRKVGLSRKAPIAENFKRLKSFHDSQVLQNTKQKGLLARVRQALHRDPFIYE